MTGEEGSVVARDTSVEPWLRGTLRELDPLRRAVVHALELCGEDAERFADGLSPRQMFLKPTARLPAVAFQLRHTVRSLDRLLTYMDGRMLDPVQREALRTEHAGTFVEDDEVPLPGEDAAEAVRAEFREALAQAQARVRAVDASYAAVRGVGQQGLPTTVGGLLVHCAEHSQRHSGQMITTALLVSGR